MSHPALRPGNLAVITGAAAGGIGYSIASRLASPPYQMRVCLADISQELLDKAKSTLVTENKVNDQDILTVKTDVASSESVDNLKEKAYQWGGKVDVLVLNAGVSGSTTPWSQRENWNKILNTNFYGVLNGLQSFTQSMIDSKQPAAIVFTGSKQGITCPPGNPAYNVSKSAVKSLAEATAHSLRNEAPQISAHLLVPGWTYTKLTTGGSTNVPDLNSKPKGAWTADQVADELLTRMSKGDFYIICPDNDVKWEIDQGRMAWTMGDVIENRPPLSRWHPEFKEKFEQHMANYKK